ncbi:hypothetical protein Tco_1409295 [Tanacetum coccineum]
MSTAEAGICFIVLHAVLKHVEKGTVEIYFVGTEYQLADLFTKALPKERFEYLVHRIGMRCMTPTQLESLTNVSDSNQKRESSSFLEEFIVIKIFSSVVRTRDQDAPHDDAHPRGSNTCTKGEDIRDRSICNLESLRLDNYTVEEPCPSTQCYHETHISVHPGVQSPYGKERHDFQLEENILKEPMPKKTINSH